MPTKPAIPPTSHTTQPIRPNDALPQWLLIPAFGIGIPLLTHMTDGMPLTNWQLKLSYLYNIGIAFIIYQGNRYLHFTLRSYFDWYKKPIRKIIVMLLGIVFFTLPVSVLLMVGWYSIFAGGIINWAVIKTASLVVLACVVFVVHVYETAFVVAESQSEIVKNAQLQQSKAEAELQLLKNQIDPHFIFNSLNTLSHLIGQDGEKAQHFNDSLADVYRYILNNRDRDLVLLREEAGFIKDYFLLLKIRFEDAVQMNVELPDAWLDGYLIPPISLQIMVENAIKHNEFSDARPMVIDIRPDGDAIIVSNPVRQKTLRKPSSKIGLQNLNNRYRLVTGKQITISQDAASFTASLPLLSLSDV